MKRNAKRTAHIGVPVTPTEKNRIEKAARATGHTTAAWVRAAALKEIGR